MEKADVMVNDKVIVGCDGYQYRIIYSPLLFPPQLDIGEVSAICCDSKDNLIVYSRGKTKLSRFSPQGNFCVDLTVDEMENAHGLYIAQDDSLYCTDQVANKIFLVSDSGEMLAAIDGSCGLFCKPTDCCLTPSGELLVSDGYGHTFIHRFSSELQWVDKWGKPGNAQDALILPHCVRQDKKGRIFVCDRENDRIVVHSDTGQVIDVWQDLLRPSMVVLDDVNELVYVAELDYRVSILSYKGERVCQFGQGRDEEANIVFRGFVHGIAVNSQGDIFIAETMVDRSVLKFERIHTE